MLQRWPNEASGNYTTKVRKGEYRMQQSKKKKK